MRSVPHRALRALLACIVAAVIAQSDARAQGTLIPLTTRRDMVFNHAGTYLYVTTSDGWVRPYNLVTRQLEAGYNLGGALRGVDITPDDSTLLITQDTTSGTQGTLHRLNLNTGAITNILYTRDPNYDEAGGWDVVIGPNGHAFFSAIASGTGPVPLREINLSNNTISNRTDTHTGRYMGFIGGHSQLHRSADRTRMLLVEADAGTSFYLYNEATDLFELPVYVYVYQIQAIASINRDGSLLGSRRDHYVSIDSSSDFNFRHSFDGLDSGIAFDAVQDLVYVVNTTTDQIVAYDTNSFAEAFRLVIGENIPPSNPYDVTAGQFGTGALVASQDGRYLAVETPSGVRVLSISTNQSPPPPPIFGKPRDMIFDHAGQHLYITTATGLVWPYNLSSGTLESPYNVGGSLNAVDISPDDSFLLIGEDNTGVGKGVVHRLDLSTGAVVQITYPIERATYENGTWDLAIAANGLALMTTVYGSPGGSGWVPLRQIDLATNTASIRTDVTGSSKSRVDGCTMVDRSADRTRLLLREPNSSNGPIFIYSSETNAFGPAAEIYNFNENLNSAVNRDGSLMILRYHADSSMNLLPTYDFVHGWTGIDSGVAFDAIDDTLYAIKSSTNQIIAYNTNTFSERYHVAIGEDVPPTPTEPHFPSDPPAQSQFTTGTLVASQDGHYLALFTPTAVRIIDLANGTSRALSTLPRLGNISTRAVVGAGSDVPIGGFIVTGTDPKKLLVRAIGPSLTSAGVEGALQDPILELHDHTGAVIATDDNWRDSQETEIASTGLAPGDDREAGVVATLVPGSYTAIMRGKNNTTGLGLVEVYDLDSYANSACANISTRGFVGIGDNVMIAGIIVSNRGGSVGGSAKFILRGLGPSLAQFVSHPLQDPMLWLYNSNGATTNINNNWQDTQRTEIQNSGLAPTNTRESAIAVELPPGNYTAILRGVDNTSGVGLVEVYALQ